MQFDKTTRTATHVVTNGRRSHLALPFPSAAADGLVGGEWLVAVAVQRHVGLEGGELEEVLAAGGARVRGLAHVRLEVALEGGELGEGLAAHLALERLGPQVQLHVVAQVRLAREGL